MYRVTDKQTCTCCHVTGKHVPVVV